MLRSNAKADAKQSYFGEDAPVGVIARIPQHHRNWMIICNMTQEYQIGHSLSDWVTTLQLFLAQNPS